MMEQTDNVLKPYYKTIRSLLKVRNEKDILHIFREENMECVWYNHDNWDGGIDYYQLQINVSPFLYDKLNKEEVRKKLLELFDQVISTEAIVIDVVNIVPDVSVDTRMEETVNYTNNIKIFITHIDSPYVFNEDVKVSEFPCLSLLSNTWDDYGTEASFCLSYYDALGKRKFIGKLKIIGDVLKDKDVLVFIKVW